MINNKYLLFDKDYKFHLYEKEISLKGNVLKVISTGICGSDLHIIDNKIPVQFPIILGHEIIGRIERLDNPEDLICYDKLKIGDVVILAPGFKCDECIKCKNGEPCINRTFYGISLPFDGNFYGGLSQYVTLHKNTKLYKVPDSISYDDGVLVEVMAACIRAVKKALNEKYSINKNVLILGSGVIGMTTALIAQIYGARPLICDLISHRLEKASNFYNIDTLHINNRSDEVVIKDIYNHFNGLPDIIIECAGTIKAIEYAFKALNKRGRLVIFGNYANVGNYAMSPSFICLNDVEVKGTSETYPEDITDALSIIQTYPNIKFNKMITHKFDLTEYEEAFKIAINRQGVKVIFDMR
jgi:2-desacetyl-2-hydroxyethyl bacteriochlorophyllide A dehydrogenase